MVGVQLLSQLTCEMNQISEADASRSLTKHRKIASSFRDTQLFEIFRLSCTLLSQARENCKSLNFNDESQVEVNVNQTGSDHFADRIFLITARVDDSTAQVGAQLSDF